MVVHRKKYSKELKMEIVEAALSGKSPLVLGKEYDIAPNMISRWKR
jgi:transposase-like protein